MVSNGGLWVQAMRSGVFCLPGTNDLPCSPWVADLLKFNEEQKKNYITEVIKADFQESGDEDVFRKIKKDLEGKNIQDTEIRQKMSEFLEEAKK